MASLVADTHAIVWYLLRSTRLSIVARERMEATVAGGDPILLPSICLVELVYLAEKGRIPKNDWKELEEALASEETSVRVIPLFESIARAVTRIPRAKVPDMPDRIIAATALHLGLPLISRDRRIQASGIKTFW